VELHWPKPIKPAEIEVRAGNTLRTLELKEASASAELKGIAFKEGNRELNVSLLRDGKREDPYRVILKRVSVGKQ
jgi:hypothetical protein